MRYHSVTWNRVSVAVDDVGDFYCNSVSVVHSGGYLVGAAAAHLVVELEAFELFRVSDAERDDCRCHLVREVHEEQRVDNVEDKVEHSDQLQLVHNYHVGREHEHCYVVDAAHAVEHVLHRECYVVERREALVESLQRSHAPEDDEEHAADQPAYHSHAILRSKRHHHVHQVHGEHAEQHHQVHITFVLEAPQILSGDLEIHRSSARIKGFTKIIG